MEVYKNIKESTFCSTSNKIFNYFKGVSYYEIDFKIDNMIYTNVVNIISEDIYKTKVTNKIKNDVLNLYLFL